MRLSSSREKIEGVERERDGDGVPTTGSRMMSDNRTLRRSESPLETFKNAEASAMPVRLWKTPRGRRNGLLVGALTTAATVKVATLGENPLTAYEAAVIAHPVFAKACTSGIAYGLGDAISQLLLGKDMDNIDLARSCRSGIAGFVGHGPLCHYWLIFMETYLDFGGAWWAVFPKIVADQTVWSYYLVCQYAAFIGILAGKPTAEVVRDVKVTAWPALRSSWRFWPYVHLISFSHFMPMNFKLLFIDVLEVVWCCILSRVSNEGKDEIVAAEGLEMGPTPVERR